VQIVVTAILVSVSSGRIERFCVTIPKAVRILAAVRMSNDSQPTANLSGTILCRRLGRFNWLISGSFQQAANRPLNH
jgi:hypothetical protein